MLEWSEFARHLGRELAGLERDTILIVREHDESRHYVQAMREPDRLYAEAVSNNFLDGPLLLTLADEEVMSEAGWRPPAEPGPDGAPAAGPRNWWTELPAYATAADHDRLADVMVTALRDVQGVRRPSDLVYESFHRHGTGLIELLDFGIDTADPGRVSKRRRTSTEGPAWDGEAGQAAPASVPAASVPALAAPVPGFEPEPQGPPGPQSRPGPQDRPGPQVPTGPQGRPSQGQTGPQGQPMQGQTGSQGQVGPQGQTGPQSQAGRPAQGAEPPGPDELEARLAEAKGRGDHTTSFELLLSADLVLPATGPAVEDPDAADFPTTMIAGSTYIVAFTSPHALVRSGYRPDLYRRTTFSQLSLGWPDPAWQLAVNPGLPSEVHLDSAAVNRLDATQRALAQPSPQPPVPQAPAPQAPVPPPPAPPAAAPAPPRPRRPIPAPSPPPGPAEVPPAPPAGRIPAFTPATPVIASGVPLRAPHGARLWHWDGTGDEAESAVPAAVFDAIGGTWTQVRADAVPAPRRD
ncbi:TY-Chap domain-containing protein [Actinomadura sp. 9N407]|uniref:SseB family protein n=1 Tax=Actinomadura sp. 9N407 TaxID=3375154 RepID=UPI0037B8E5B8